MKTANIILTIASIVVSVWLGAAETTPMGENPATLTFNANGTVTPNNIRGNGGLPSNEIHVMKKLSDGHGNVYLTGGFTGFAAFGDSVFSAKGENDYFFAKYTSNGALLWASIPECGTNTEIGYDIAIDSLSGNVFVCGTFETHTVMYGQAFASYGGYDAMLHKYASDGTHLFTKQIVGGSGDDVAYYLAVDSCYVCVYGSFEATAHTMKGKTLVSAGQSDLFVLRLYQNGSFASVCQYGTTADEWPCRMYAGTHGVKSHCIAIVWSHTYGGSRQYVWFTKDGELDSVKAKPTPQ